MKKGFMLLFICLFVFGLLCTFNTSAYGADYKIACVDVEKVFNEYEKTKVNDEVLKNEGKEKAEERRVMVEEIQKMRADAELLSESARAEKQGEIEQKIKTLQAFDEKTRAELREKRDEFLRGIFDDIKVVIEGIGKEGDYTFIINEKALLYKVDAVDITDQVVNEINKGAKKE